MEKISHTKTEQLLKKYKIPTVRQLLARNEKEASEFSRKIGFPVAMKISSPKIIHKSEVKGVALGIDNEEQARRSFKEMMRNARKVKGAKIEGVIVQEQLEGVEIIMGSKQDPSFGPALMFGLGGIFVEILKDVSFRLVPLERKDAREMIQEIKGYPILKGVRGQKGVNLRALEDCLISLSRMVSKEKIQELDINPLFADHGGVKAADVRILV